MRANLTLPLEEDMESVFTGFHEDLIPYHLRQSLQNRSSISSCAETLESYTSSLSPSDLLKEETISNSIEDDINEEESMSNEADVKDEDSPGSQPLAPKHQSTAQPPVVVKRGRGRPRKIPVETPKAKGRSKTGCITCRRRKKKCDETKPSCLNCQKNNALCGGYPPRAKWQGRDKATGRAMPRDLPILISGVEDELDTHLVDHFSLKLSALLNPWREENVPNPFTDLLLPMAIRHRGLMHSLLCLSATHLYTSERSLEVQQRQWSHFGMAVEHVRNDQSLSACRNDPSTTVDDPTAAATLILAINSVMAGDKNGEYRIHIDAANFMINARKNRKSDFDKFLREYFQYINISTSLTTLERRVSFEPQETSSPDLSDSETSGHPPTEAKSYIGVLDGLFELLSRVLALRDRVRERRRENLRPYIDYAILLEARTMDSDLRQWVSPWPATSTRAYASLLYRQCIWIYLQQSVAHSVVSSNVRDAIDAGLAYISQLESSPGTLAVLLMPLFILGCVAQEETQRQKVLEHLDKVYEYRKSGNVRLVQDVIALKWQNMDHGNEDALDWETLMAREGLDFLVI